jgi:hypothetical protein
MSVSIIALALAIAALVIVVVGLVQDGRQALAWAVALLAVAQIIRAL